LKQSFGRFDPEKSSTPKHSNQQGISKKQVQVELQDTPQSSTKRRRSESETSGASRKKLKLIRKASTSIKLIRKASTSTDQKTHRGVKSCQDPAKKSLPASTKRRSSRCVVKEEGKKTTQPPNKKMFQRQGAAAAKSKRGPKLERSRSKGRSSSAIENKKQLQLQDARSSKKRPRSTSEEVGRNRKIAKVELADDAELEVYNPTTQADGRRTRKRSRKSTLK